MKQKVILFCLCIHVFLTSIYAQPSVARTMIDDGNLGTNVMKQLWMRNRTMNAGIEYIDSRHLYLNQMDALELVTAIFIDGLGTEIEQILLSWVQPFVHGTTGMCAMNKTL